MDLLLRVTSVPGATATAPATSAASPPSFVRLGVVAPADGAAAPMLGRRMYVPSS